MQMAAVLRICEAHRTSASECFMLSTRQFRPVLSGLSD